MCSSVSEMFTRHSGSDLLELELADFKEARKYRILAFDKVINRKLTKKIIILQGNNQVQ